MATVVTAVSGWRRPASAAVAISPADAPQEVAPQEVTPQAVALTPPGQLADEAVRELYRAHALALTRMAKLLLRDQPAAEDAVQEAFLGLYRALPRLRDPDKLLPYLRAAVINRCRSELRTRRRLALRGIPYEPPASSAEYAAIAAEDRRAVLEAVAALPHRAREVLVLRYYLDLPDDEIAATLGISRGTVSSTASRAVAALAIALKEER